MIWGNATRASRPLWDRAICPQAGPTAGITAAAGTTGVFPIVHTAYYFYKRF